MMKRTYRQSYGLLDLFGDIGGIIDALYYFSAALFYPYWSFNYRRFILTKLFKTRKEQSKEKNNSAQGKYLTGLKKLQLAFQPLSKIPSMPFAIYLLCLCGRKRKDFS